MCWIGDNLEHEDCKIYIISAATDCDELKILEESADHPKKKKIIIQLTPSLCTRFML